MWTIYMLVILLCILLVIFIREKPAKNHGTGEVPPSAAIIEQICPQEILEQILLYCDSSALSRLAQVSKFWHYHCSNIYIRGYIFDREISELRISDEELRANLNEEAEVEIIRLTYPPHYKKEWLVQDYANRNLIDADYEILKRLKASLPKSTQTKCKVKLRVVCLRVTDQHWEFKRQTTIPIGPLRVSKTLPPAIDRAIRDVFIKGRVVDLTTWLSEVDTGTFEFLGIRPVDPPKKLFGFLPPHYDLPAVLKVLIGPCLFADYLHHIGPIHRNFIQSCVSVLFMAMLVLGAHNQATRALPTRKQKVIGTAILALFFAALFTVSFVYLWQFAKIFLLSFPAIYGTYMISLHSVRDYYSTAIDTRLSRVILLTAGGIMLLANDWSKTIAAVLNGEIFLTLLYNIASFILLTVLFQLLQVTEISIRRQRLSTSGLLPWNKARLQRSLVASIWTLVITIYSPNIADYL